MRAAAGVPHPLGRTLHKITLYLILLDLLLLLGYGLRSAEQELAGFVVLSLLMLVYQCLLGRLLFLQARRSNDGYLVYPVVMAGLIFAVLLFRSALSVPGMAS